MPYRVRTNLAHYLLLPLFLAGCTAAPAPEMLTSSASPTLTLPATATATTAPTATLTLAPTPTYTPTPTPEPPIPCDIAFDTDRDGNREIYSMGPDGSDPRNLSNDPADDWAPAWSPDGEWITFVSNRENDLGAAQAIYVMDRDGGHLRLLSQSKYSDYPEWSNIGDRIVFMSDDDIYVMNADGSGEPLRLTNSPEKDTQPTWSPDDSQIAWLSGNDWKWDILVMDADGGNVRRLTSNGKANDVAWTVDGQIFTHWESPAGECFNCIMNADGSNVMNAGGKGDIQRYIPFWTADGNRVELVSGALDGGNEEIFLVGEIFPDIFFNLTNNGARDLNPDWPARCGPRDQVATTMIESVGDQVENIQPEKDQPEVVQPKEADTEVIIGYAGDDPTQSQRRADFLQACDELGVQCMIGGIPDLLDQGVSAIVQNTSRANPNLRQDLEPATARGIPVLLLDAELDLGGVYSITVNQDEWVGVGVEWLLAGMTGKGDIAIFDYRPSTDHTPIITNLLEKHPDAQVVEEFDASFQRSDIDAAVRGLVQTDPQIGAIWTNRYWNEVIWGVSGAGVSFDHWPKMLCDPTKLGLYVWKDIQEKEQPGFRCMAVSNPPGIAYDAVYAANELIQGAQVNPAALAGKYGNAFYVDFPIVTDDNLVDWLKQVDREKDSYILDDLLDPAKIKEGWFLE